jgi:HlyD family secretion protein
MTLTPTNAPLQAELWVSTGDVAFLRPGDPAELKIDAFDSAEHGAAKGKVVSISEDMYTTDDKGAPLPNGAPPYYKVRVAITEVNLVDVPPSLRLIPGMTLVGDIKVGTRPLGMYILGGMMRTVGNGMREP